MQQSNNKNIISADLENMVDAAWGLCRIVLFPHIIVKGSELEKAKAGIRTILLTHCDQYAGYVELIHRIMLTLAYTRLYGNCQLPPRPLPWLENSEALRLSVTWYRALEKKRKDDPLYKLEWKALAEAILEITNNHTDEIESYWHGWFIKHNAIGEWIIYRHYIVHLNWKK